jgi:hypothetical protein
MLVPLLLLIAVIGGMAGLLVLTEWLDTRLEAQSEPSTAATAADSDVVAA